jgi:DNA replication licensing factor MCM5
MRGLNDVSPYVPSVCRPYGTDQPPTQLHVLMDDIIAHDAELAKEVRSAPNVYVALLEAAAVECIKSLRSEAGAYTRSHSRST